MKTARKLLVLLLAAVMCITLLAACGSNEPQTPSGTQPDSAPAPANTDASAANAGDVDRSDWVKLDLSYSTHLSENNSTNDLLMVYFYGRLQDEMPGYINITPYYNGTLVGQTEALDGIIDGISDLTVFEPATFSARMPVTCMFAYPGVFCGSGTAGTAAFYEFVTTENLEELNDIHVLWCDRSPPACLATTGTVADVSDLSGLQIRGTAIFGDTLSALGAVPTSIPINDVYEAMRNGLADGIYQSCAVLAMCKLQEVAESGVILPLVSSPTIFAMNKDVYESMPDSQRAVFDACAEETFNNLVLTFQDNVNATTSMAEFLQGINVQFAEGAALDNATAKTSTLLDNYVENTLNAQGLDGDHYLARYKELADKYNELYTYEDFQAMINSIIDGSMELITSQEVVTNALDATRAELGK